LYKKPWRWTGIGEGARQGEQSPRDETCRAPGGLAAVAGGRRLRETLRPRTDSPSAAKPIEAMCMGREPPVAWNLPRACTQRSCLPRVGATRGPCLLGIRTFPVMWGGTSPRGLHYRVGFDGASASTSQRAASPMLVPVGVTAHCWSSATLVLAGCTRDSRPRELFGASLSVADAFACYVEVKRLECQAFAAPES
jgi:hypothetical protein